jgi:S-formylglutathione hydrolase FrmB
VFEYVAGMSSSFWWGDGMMMGVIRMGGCQDITYYLDSGAAGASQDGAPNTRLMRDALVELGCPHTHVEQPEGTHDWSFWRQRFPNVLNAFEAVYTQP